MSLDELIADVQDIRNRAEHAEKISKELNKLKEESEQALFDAMQRENLTSLKKESGQTITASSRDYYSLKSKTKSDALDRLESLGFGEHIETKRDIDKRKIAKVIKSLPLKTQMQLLNDDLITIYNKPIITIRNN